MIRIGISSGQHTSQEGINGIYSKGPLPQPSFYVVRRVALFQKYKFRGKSSNTTSTIAEQKHGQIEKKEEWDPWRKGLSTAPTYLISSPLPLTPIHVLLQLQTSSFSFGLWERDDQGNRKESYHCNTTQLSTIHVAMINFCKYLPAAALSLSFFPPTIQYVSRGKQSTVKERRKNIYFYFSFKSAFIRHVLYPTTLLPRFLLYRNMSGGNLPSPEASSSPLCFVQCNEESPRRKRRTG